jgi:hypothetical protein
MHFEAAEDLAVQLLEVCLAESTRASRLALRARSHELRSMLTERAQEYERAGREFGARLPGAVTVPLDRHAAGPEPARSDREIALQWEMAECAALIHFRDAYDTRLPSDLQDAVRSQLEDGVGALERVRAFARRAGP